MNVGERGPKSNVVKRLSNEQRGELDEAIVEGRATKTELFERFGEPHGISYSAFCNYAAQLANRARHRYVGELLVKTFGNLPDADIDARARGIIMAMIDRIAADVLHDGELKPKDLREVVQAFDLIRRGAIAEAQEDRRKMEAEAARMAGVAEAATWLKDALTAEVDNDPELLRRIEQAIDRCRGRVEAPSDKRAAAKLLRGIARKSNWERGVAEMVKYMFGIDIRERQARPRKSEETVRREVREVYGMGPEGDDFVQASEDGKG